MVRQGYIGRKAVLTNAGRSQDDRKKNAFGFVFPRLPVENERDLFANVTGTPSRFGHGTTASPCKPSTGEGIDSALLQISPIPVRTTGERIAISPSLLEALALFAPDTSITIEDNNKKDSMAKIPSILPQPRGTLRDSYLHTNDPSVKLSSSSSNKFRASGTVLKTPNTIGSQRESGVSTNLRRVLHTIDRKVGSNELIEYDYAIHAPRFSSEFRNADENLPDQAGELMPSIFLESSLSQNKAEIVALEQEITIGHSTVASLETQLEGERSKQAALQRLLVEKRQMQSELQAELERCNALF